jgi:lipopolysaccharide export system permease protein
MSPGDWTIRAGMSRLTRYLVGLFVTEAAALFSVAISILFLAQCLRVIDAGSVRGQGLLSLFTQALLALPSTGMAFFYVCVAIGLARALNTMQRTRELHIMHVSQKLPTLLSAIAIFSVLSCIVLMAVAHVINPLANSEANAIRTRAAADLVGRALVPNRFAELSNGVTVTVGGRRPNGEITSFFADDRRDSTRRTYIADSALITSDEDGYVLQLSNGTIQYRTAEGKFSEIAYERYDMALERLTGEVDTETRGDQTSIAIIQAALADGDWNADRVKKLSARTVDGLRVLVLCLFVAAYAIFPSGRRRERQAPIEIVVLGAAFFERIIHTYLPGEGWLEPASGIIALTAVSLLMLVVRLRLFALPPRLEARQ